jgi:transposase
MWDGAMRGADDRAEGLVSDVSRESRVPDGHPLRLILPIVDAALADLAVEFASLDARLGRPSIPPERLLRALLLQALFSVRSARQLMEQLDHSLLFRWLVGLGVDDPAWDVTLLTKTRDRRLAAEIAGKFFRAVLGQARVEAWLSDGHFSVAGSLIQAWASMRSLRPSDGSGGWTIASSNPAPGRNGERDFHGERRSNATHASTTDGEARLDRKGRGKEAKLCFMGHLLMENRDGLVVDAALGEARGDGRPAPGDARCRQGIRHGGLRRGDPAAQGHAARRPEPERPPLGARRPDQPPPGLCHEPAPPQADRGGLRLDQDDRRPGASPLSWHRPHRLVVHPRRRGR